MKIIGHRGSSFTAPENTLASMRLAWEESAEGVEFDLQATRDRRIVVLHDANLLRTTGRDAEAASLTLAEIRGLDAGSWKGPEWRGERVPEFAELLAIAPADKLLFIEIKCGSGILPVVKADLQAAGVEPERTVFVGFSLDTMRRVKQAFPDREVLLNVDLGEASRPGRWVPSVEDLLSVARATGIDGWGIGYREAVDDASLSRLIDNGRVFAWTIDDPAVAARMGALGVHCLATNRPGWLRARLPVLK